MSLTRLQLEDWLKEQNVEASKILDVGGAQLPILSRLGNVKYNDYQILDLPEPHEVKEVPNIFYDLNQDLLFASGNLESYRRYFDTVFCIEVAEYWYNPLNALKTINSLMETGGVLYISFTFLYPVHKPDGADYLRYTPDGAVKLLHEAGFEIVENRPRIIKDENAMKLFAFYNFEGFKASKTADHKIIGNLIKAVKKTDTLL